ncbi:MAG: hypothetical protein ABIZ56_12950 [Chthoniobacteraceae bacterium]
MKRRSPWLTFAACALLNGTLLAERAPKKQEQPRLALSAAASAVEAELEKRGLAGDHTVSSMTIVSSKGPAYYVADIDPPILIPLTPVTAKLTFQVGMDGRVTAKQVAAGNKGSPRLKST